MSTTFYKVAVFLLSAAVLVLSLALYISHRMNVERSPIVETLILRVPGVTFTPRGVAYDVTVWNRTKTSTSAFDAQDIFQTRIEVTNASETFRYEWPREYECAPDSAELRDLLGNGTKVFVISCGMDSRIVQFTGNLFLFRPTADRLERVGSQSRFVDLGNDARVEYIASLNYPQKFGDPENYLTLPFPVVYQWTPERGFQEVSQQFHEFYRKQAIPELRKLQNDAEDPARKPLFDSAIAYIEQRISSPAGQQMLPSK